MSEYLQPAFGRTEFTCPHCNHESSILWKTIRQSEIIDFNMEVESDHLALCTLCNQSMIFRRRLREIDDDGNSHHTSLMLYPKHVAIPATKDMPEHIQDIYKEASFVLGDSPRASCALLRLALQELMIYLRDNCKYSDLTGKDINKDIGSLVRNHNISNKLQQAFDSIRIVGNNALHPGELNINDNPEIAKELFEVLNLIIDEMITQSQSRKIKELYEKMPENERNWVLDRDKNKTQ